MSVTHFEINHLQTDKGGKFYFQENGKELAQMVYLNAGVNLIVIEHTDVHSSLQGKGTGKILLENLVNYARQKNLQVIPLCPFARATFEKTPEWQDVLAPIKAYPKNKSV